MSADLRERRALLRVRDQDLGDQVLQLVGDGLSGRELVLDFQDALEDRLESRVGVFRSVVASSASSVGLAVARSLEGVGAEDHRVEHDLCFFVEGEKDGKRERERERNNQFHFRCHHPRRRPARRKQKMKKKKAEKQILLPYPRRPHVRRRPVVGARSRSPHHLGRGVPGRPDLCLRPRVVDVLRVPKVAQLDERPRLGAVEQRVLELDVSVCHAHPVAVVEAHDELLEEEAGVVLGEAPAGGDVGEEVLSLSLLSLFFVFFC